MTRYIQLYRERKERKVNRRKPQTRRAHELATGALGTQVEFSGVFAGECLFFNKTRNSRCPHRPVVVIIQPDGAETDACNGHASAFFLHWTKRNPGQIWTGAIVRYTK